MAAPKVFISHATEDKAKFVEAFAKRLLADGVDVWLDQWEIQPGQDFVGKIFNEGLKEAQIVLIVISETSVKKPWVQEELNVSVVAKIKKGMKIIPVVLDGCEVPEVLKATLYVSVDDPSSYDASYEKIKASIFGITTKPPIGEPPPHTKAALIDVNGLDHVDNLVLKTSCEILLEEPHTIFDPAILFGASNPEVPPKENVLESLAILEGEYYVKLSHFFGGGGEHWGCRYRVTTYGFEQYCQVYVNDYQSVYDQAAALIANGKASTNYEIRDLLKVPIGIANHVINMLEDSGFVKTSDECSERMYIWEVSPKLKRALR